VLDEEVQGESTTDHEDAYIHVSLKEFSIQTNTSTVPAGSITFEAVNAGTEIHELVILRTNVAPENLTQIPGKNDNVVDRDMIVNEHDPAIAAIDEIEEFSAGTTEEKQVSLEPGRYVLLCNIPNHYKKGMFTSLHVTE
jgi:uncharacterized cupredoxin-like copper-binding protein